MLVLMFVSELSADCLAGWIWSCSADQRSIGIIILPGQYFRYPHVTRMIAFGILKTGAFDHRFFLAFALI